MEKYEVHVYTIRCLTNLHAGKGDSNYDYIDKEVQKDPLTGCPMIHASSLKGALREYFEYVWGKKDPKIAHIFGSDKDENVLKQGAYRLMEAQMLALPVRCIQGKQPYYLATTAELWASYQDRLKSMGVIDSEKSLANGADNKAVELEYGGNQRLCADQNEMKNFVKIDQKEMGNAVKYLPVVARNSLENGQSTNLWYEQVVPRETLFYFCIAMPAKDNHFSDFNASLDNKTVQIGANATVGYGYCQLKHIYSSLLKDTKDETTA